MKKEILLYIVLGVIALFLINKILDTVADPFTESAEEKKEKEKAQALYSMRAFNPNYWRTFSPITFSMLNTKNASFVNSAQVVNYYMEMASVILDAKGIIDNEDNVVVAFKTLKSKFQISYLSDIFENTIHGGDLVQYLMSFMDDKYSAVIYDYVKNLPES